MVSRLLDRRGLHVGRVGKPVLAKKGRGEIKIKRMRTFVRAYVRAFERSTCALLGRMRACAVGRLGREVS